jgi:hypothetical protein
MEKSGASTHRGRCFFWPAGLFLVMMSLQSAAAISLSQADALRIGKKIWQNECNGTVSGLTSWNGGEEFASLGIGHFIWYPAEKSGPFEESFPKLIDFMSERGAKLPEWLRNASACPWRSQAEFEHAQNSTQMNELRNLLARTVDLQAQFLVDRLERALPMMLDETSAANRVNVQAQFARVASSPQGCYALVDYVNFKGEGVRHSERYHGEGWGLLQVLEHMQGANNVDKAVAEFSRGAAAILRRRVKNSPPERREARWLPGWIARVNSYAANR